MQNDVCDWSALFIYFSIKKEITDASYLNYNMVISIISITGHVLISEKLNHEKIKGAS